MADTWTVQEAKAKLSEILRRARAGKPQRIGAKGEYVLVSEDDWNKRQGRKSLPKNLQRIAGETSGQWLVRTAPRIGEIELPPRDSDRPNPFLTKTLGRKK
jgi:prevent-host-death family protein